MRRILTIIFASALAWGAAAASAQEASPEAGSAEPSEKSVLQAARDKYWSGRQAESKAAEAPAGASAASDAPEAAPGAPVPAKEVPLEAGTAARAGKDDFPFALVHVSFVPGLSHPRGVCDSIFAVGAIGDISRDLRGAQASSVFGIARNVRGVQASGVFNIADEGARGVQGAGAFNIARNLGGVQGAGAFNIAGKVGGVQAAGVFNIAGDVDGVQAAGVFNVARRVKGAQFGIVNVAKDVEGVQLGLFNFSETGIHTPGFGYEPETSFAYTYWQSGTRDLYTTWSYGATVRNWEADFGDSVLGLGIGSRHSLSELDIDADLSAFCSVKVCAAKGLGFSVERIDGRGGDPDDSFRLRSAPNFWPSARIEASLPVGKHWRVFGAVRADIGFDSLGDLVPDELKGKTCWEGKAWGEGFSVWPKWSVGLKI